MNTDDVNLRMPANYEIKYGYSRLERIVVKINHHEYNSILKEAAREQIQGRDMSGWGASVEMHEEHDGVGVHTKRWAEVTFQRKVKETEEEHDEPQV